MKIYLSPVNMQWDAVALAANKAFRNQTLIHSRMASKWKSDTINFKRAEFIFK